MTTALIVFFASRKLMWITESRPKRGLVWCLIRLGEGGRDLEARMLSYVHRQELDLRIIDVMDSVCLIGVH